MTGNLPAIQDKNFTSKFLGKILKNTADGITGTFVTERKEHILAANRIFQGLLNGNFIQTVKTEWDDLKSKGRIKDDYEHTEQHHACLKEMLDFLDQDGPDKTRFEFMKKIFLMAATENVENRESLLPQQYMNLCRKLSSGDIFVLLTTYAVSKTDWKDKRSRSLRTWLDKIKIESGLKDRELVELYERNLIEHKLLTDRNTRVRPQGEVEQGEHCRLTDLAINICKYIEAYDEGDEIAGD